MPCAIFYKGKYVYATDGTIVFSIYIFRQTLNEMIAASQDAHRVTLLRRVLDLWLDEAANGPHNIKDLRLDNIILQTEDSDAIKAIMTRSREKILRYGKQIPRDEFNRLVPPGGQNASQDVPVKHIAEFMSNVIDLLEGKQIDYSIPHPF